MVGPQRLLKRDVIIKHVGMRSREACSNASTAVRDGHLKNRSLSVPTLVVELSANDGAEGVVAVLKHISEELDDDVLHG